jgi:hypothetical protein
MLIGMNTSAEYLGQLFTALAMGMLAMAVIAITLLGLREMADWITPESRRR